MPYSILQASRDCDAPDDARGYMVNAGVRFPGLIHPGLIGTAPSQELLDIWNEREKKLVDDGEKNITLGGVLHTRPLGRLPAPAHPHYCMQCFRLPWASNNIVRLCYMYSDCRV